MGPGIEVTSTYVTPGDFAPGVPIYGRYDNATWAALESVLARLEGVDPATDRHSDGHGGALVFSSGMAAAAALFALVPRGGTLVVGSTSYNTVLALARELADAGEWALRLVDVTDLDAVYEACDGADWLHLESPTNPLIEVADLAAIGEITDDLGVTLSVDNTFATPLLQNPIDLGADIVMHSATKYISGHSDVVLGALVTRDAEFYASLAHHRSTTGAIAGPFEAWLALRGVRTLPVRFARQQETAGELARRLAGHPAVTRVRYPGLPEDPGHEVAARTMRGFGAMLAIDLPNADAARALTERVVLWVPATSLGGVESLLERRRRIPSEPATVPEGLVRLSVGLEDVEDLWSDLSSALDSLL